MLKKWGSLKNEREALCLDHRVKRRGTVDKASKQAWNEVCRALEAIFEVLASIFRTRKIQGNHMIWCEIALALAWRMNWMRSESIELPSWLLQQLRQEITEFRLG